MTLVVPVILSGGSGSRLWPKSRQHYPKQLHRLYGDCTMLQATIKRVKHLGPKGLIVCNQDQRFMVAEQALTVNYPCEIVLEPVARNTAPAILCAALKAIQDAPDAVIAVFPADHLIQDLTEFNQALQQAVVIASENRLVTFGVVPTRAETGYGYIKIRSAVAQLLQIESFVEKPSLEKAQAYLESGDYYWNSGMFVMAAQHLIDVALQLEPAMVEACRLALKHAVKDLDFCRLDEATFKQAPNVSIDYAVLEKVSDAYMVPLTCRWSDVGSWQALWEVGDGDALGNVLVGDVMMHNAHDCYVNADHRLIAMVGVEDLVVVETSDSVLIAHKSCSQDVKYVVDRLKEAGRSEYLAHREVYRPWGSYDLVDQGDRYQVKRITVKPAASLSLQMHHHRAEHWVVVSGTALVEKGNESFMLTENQSVYIPLGEKHRLSNPGKVPLRLIEVASGTYLSEDDIVRFEDGYGRI